MNASGQPGATDTAAGDNALCRRPAFVTTHWSVVLAAGRSETTQARNAIEQLCRIYWQPLYAYVRRRGYSAEDAHDLAQEFFAAVAGRHWLARVDQA